METIVFSIVNLLFALHFIINRKPAGNEGVIQLIYYLGCGIFGVLSSTLMILAIIGRHYAMSALILLFSFCFCVISRFQAVFKNDLRGYAAEQIDTDQYLQGVSLYIRVLFVGKIVCVFVIGILVFVTFIPGP